MGSHSMLLQDTFSNNARLSKTGTLSYYVMNGLSGRNLTYPDGMSKDYAFQSVLTNLEDSAETRVTVDGLTNGERDQHCSGGLGGNPQERQHHGDRGGVLDEPAERVGATPLLLDEVLGGVPAHPAERGVDGREGEAEHDRDQCREKENNHGFTRRSAE